MKLILSILFITSFSLNAYSQLPEFEIHINDTVYMNKTLFMTKGDKDIYSWNIKHNLERGKYYVYEKNECGKDTIMYAEFSEDGVKNGEWKEWNRRLCGEALNEDLTSKNEWSFLFDKNELSGLTIYKNNFIIKSIWDFYGSEPHLVNYYPENAIRRSDWSRMISFRKNGNYEWILTSDSLNSSIMSEYDEEGNIWSVIKLIDEELKLSNVELFYPTGEIWAKGNYIEIDSGSVENGDWTYWDKEGKVIAEVNFNKGEIVDYQRFQNKKITPAYINELVLPRKE